MEIKSILVTSIAPFDNHIANGGEKLLGNASSIKKRIDERVYVSGQMQRHVLFSAIDRLNDTDTNKGETFVSNGDGVTKRIELDLRADLGGFMVPSVGDFSGKRVSPISVTPAVALEESTINTDLLVRFKENTNVNANEQTLATKEFSQHDMMLMNFFIDISSVGISKKFEYKQQFFLKRIFVKHINEQERLRRVNLFINATKLMNDYANQARNAVSGEPQKVLIVFDNIFSRKTSRYWNAELIEQKNLLEELNDRKAKYFIGDDTKNNQDGTLSVYNAYKKALEFLNNQGNTLYDPCGGDSNIVNYENSFDN